MNSFLLILAFSLSCFFVPHALADDHEDEDEHHLHRRTNSEVADFIEEHLPEALEILHQAEEEEDEEGVDEFWREAHGFVGAFYLAREELGDKAARAYLGMRQTELAADRLADAFHHEQQEDNRENIERDLHKVISEHLEFRLLFQSAELDRARKELEHAARELEEFAESREDLVREEVEQRLHGDEEDEEDE
tara:strand:+ start:80 stop:658 length:579 start_codon:yes stop_codon:yes gene_type:complete